MGEFTKQNNSDNNCRDHRDEDNYSTKIVIGSYET